jgi:hypothetical protein
MLTRLHLLKGLHRAGAGAVHGPVDGAGDITACDLSVIRCVHCLLACHLLQATVKLKAAEEAGSAAERDAAAREALAGLLRVPQCVNLSQMVGRLAFLRQYEVRRPRMPHVSAACYELGCHSHTVGRMGMDGSCNHNTSELSATTPWRPLYVYGCCLAGGNAAQHLHVATC